MKTKKNEIMDLVYKNSDPLVWTKIFTLIDEYIDLKRKDENPRHDAVILCEEQRKICADVYNESDWVEKNECYNNILNANSPEL